MTNPLYTISQLPATSQDAIRAFDDRYLAGMGAAQAPTWSDLGELIPSDSPQTTFPLSSMAFKYRRTEGESRFKTFGEKAFDLKVEEFDEGYEAKLMDLITKSFAYRNWTLAPSRLLIAEGRFRNRSLVTLLEAGHSTIWGTTAKPIDGVNFFSPTHLADFMNPASDTWSNYQSSGTDVVSLTNIKAEVTAMQGVLDENGEKLGVEPDTILVPTAKYEPLKFLLAQNMVLENGTGSAGVTNPYVGKFNVVHVPEFTDANDWYLVDSKLFASTGLPPWISLRYMAPTNSALALRYWDESSDFFKNTGRIKASSHLWYGFSLGFPQGIRKIIGA